MQESVKLKLEKINNTLCVPWGKRITNALFKGIRGFVAHEDMLSPRNSKISFRDDASQDLPKNFQLQKPNVGQVSIQEGQQGDNANVEGFNGAENKNKVLEEAESLNTIEESKNSKQTDFASRKETGNFTASGNDSENTTDKRSEKEGTNGVNESKNNEVYNARTNPKMRTVEAHNIIFEFDWKSFDELFGSLIHEKAEEVIDTILDSLISKDCAISLLSSLYQHCKPPEFSGKIVSKHEQIRSFLQQGLKKYVIKYSENSKDWGYYRDGVLCDIVEIDVTDKEEINWIFRDVTQQIEQCTEVQQFIIENYYIQHWEEKAKNVLYSPIKFKVDWAGIDYAAQDFPKAVYTLYHDQSSYVLEEIYQAIDWLATYEEDEIVDAVAYGLQTIAITLQPGPDSTKKDFDINDSLKCLTLRLCLEADEFNGVFRQKDLIPIIKLAGLYNTNFSKMFKIELLSAAASIFKVSRSDLSTFKEIVDRKDFWWTPNEKEKLAIEACTKKIERYYKDTVTQAASGSGQQSSSQQQQQQQQQQQNSVSNGGDEEDEDLENDQEFEKVIKGWHVLKINKNNLHQERFIILTNKAYWTFNYDFASGKVDDRHYKRHDLLDFSLCEIGDIDKISEKVSLTGLKVFTHEKRKKSTFGNNPEVLAIDPSKKGKKGAFSNQLRKSLGNLRDSDTTSGLEAIRNLKDSILMMERGRVKKPKPIREKPSTDGDYSSVFVPYGELGPQDIKNILLEISWCIYAVAVARQRHKVSEPFTGQFITRPKTTFMSKLYNNFGLGITSKLQKNAGKETGKEQGMDVRDVLKMQAEQKLKEMEPKMMEVALKVPGRMSDDFVRNIKPLLQKPRNQHEDSKCSHNKRVVFNQDVQIFYRDADVVIGVEGKLQDNEHKKDFEHNETDEAEENYKVIQQQQQQQQQKQQQQKMTNSLMDNNSSSAEDEAAISEVQDE